MGTAWPSSNLPDFSKCEGRRATSLPPIWYRRKSSKADRHAIQFPVVLQEKWNLSKQYGVFTTPVAFLIDENGVIAEDVAVGRDPIVALADRGLAMKASAR